MRSLSGIQSRQRRQTASIFELSMLILGSGLAALAALYATETVHMILYTAVVLLVHAKAPCATFPTAQWRQ